MLADVTELRRLDGQNHLLATAAHELKTAHDVDPHGDAPDRRAAGGRFERRCSVGSAAATRDDSDRLHKIVETLLDMDRIRSGAAMMDLRPLSGQELIRACVEPHKERLADNGIAAPRIEKFPSGPWECGRTRSG